MISSIFYFAETEQEYLDNFNRHQVKPYTIVFCKDTRSLWKNGIKYGGDRAQNAIQIQDAIENDVQPLIEQLNNAIEDANTAANEAYERLNQAISDGLDNLQDLQDAADEEKARLTSLIGNLGQSIQDKVTTMMSDSQWIQENWPQGVTTWQEGWDDSVKAYLKTAGFWNVDPETGEDVTVWSQLQQKADGIEQSVNQITKNGGTIDALRTDLLQQITAEGTARNELSSLWSEKQEDTEKILKWMYSGLTTESGKDKTLADLSAAAQDGDITGISTIGALVEKIPVIDNATGQPAVDGNGDIIYLKDDNGNYLYKSKASLSAAVNNSLATMINEATDSSASSEIVTSVGEYLAGIKSQADATSSQVSALAGSIDGDFSQMLLKDDLETAIGQIATKKGVGSGDIFSSVKKLEDGGYVSESGMDARVNNAISSFTVNANEEYASGTLVSKLNENSDNLATIATKVTGDTSTASVAAKMAGMTAGLITTANIDSAVAGLVASNENSQLKSAIQAKVDTAKEEARAGLVVENELTGKVAGILATVGKQGSQITLDADLLNITSTFIDAMNAELSVASVTTLQIQAAIADGLTIKAGKVNFVTADGSDNPYLQIDENGKLIAKDGVFSGSINIGEYSEDNTTKYANWMDNYGNGEFCYGKIAFTDDGELDIGPIHINADGSGYLGAGWTFNGQTVHGLSWNSGGALNDIFLQGTYVNVQELRALYIDTDVLYINTSVNNIQAGDTVFYLGNSNNVNSRRAVKIGSGGNLYVTLT